MNTRLSLSLLSSALLAACVSSGQPKFYFDEGAYVASAKGMVALAADGDATAELDLGYLYENGLGVPLDVTKAEEYYQKASAQGLSRADTCLGLMLLWGTHGAHDVPRGVELLKRADAAGDKYASYYLGYLYEQGGAVPKDAAEAARYKERAGTDVQDTIAQYVKDMQAHIRANQRFPGTALSGGYGGKVTVDFNIEAPYAKDAKIAVSSGHADLDDAAIAAVYQTYYPSVPPGIWAPKHFIVTINFIHP